MANENKKLDRKSDAESGLRFKIRTPNPGFTGDRFGVKFRDGTGETDDKSAAAALGELGYVVVDAEQGKVVCHAFRIVGPPDALRSANVKHGIQINSAEGFTADPDAARKCLECGLRVIDVATGKDITA